MAKSVPILPLLLVTCAALPAHATIEVVTVTQNNRQDAGLSFTLNATEHPKGSGALLIRFEIPPEQAKQLDPLPDASLIISNGDSVTLHVPARLTRSKTGTINCEFTLAAKLFSDAWFTVHAHPKSVTCSGALFNIKLAEFSKAK